MADSKLCSEEFDRSNAECQLKSESKNLGGQGSFEASPQDTSKTCCMNAGYCSGSVGKIWCDENCKKCYSSLPGVQGDCVNNGNNFLCRCIYNC